MDLQAWEPCKKDSAYIQAAGGIVYDSTPENEFAETENKLRHLITALNMVERFNWIIKKA